MGIYHIPGVVRGGKVIAGYVQSDGSAYITGKFQAATSLQVDASGYITGPLQTASGLHVDTTADFGEFVDMATGFAACGPGVCATALTVCAVAQ